MEKTIDGQASPAEGKLRLFWRALALGRDPEAVGAIDPTTPVQQVATSWPFTLVALVLAAGMSITGALLSKDAGLILPVAIAAGFVTGLGTTALFLLRVPPMNGWAPHLHVRFATLYAAGLGASLVTLLWLTSRLPMDRIQLACFIAVLGAMGVAATTLYAVRAATLGFAAAVTLAVTCFAGPGTAALMALGCFACLVIATHRLALLDAEAGACQQGAVGEGRLAAQFISEFESNGTGWFWQTDRQGVVTYLSPKIVEATATADLQPIGEQLTAIFQMDALTPGTERTIAFHLSSRTAFSDYPVRPAAAVEGDRWWSISGRPVVDEDGRFQGFIGSGGDLTEKRRAEAEITKLALFDNLTGLANRTRMRVYLDQTLKQPAGPYRPTSILLLDLDRFTAVNDTLGHQVGDALLKQVAQRLVHVIGDAGLVGRLGGDEYQIILADECDAELLSEFCQLIIASLSEPYFIDGSAIGIGCSIGVAIAPYDGGDSETLLRNADLALYSAKADGRSVHRFYREELLHGAQNRKQLEDDLRDALARDELHLVYQPVVSTEVARIVGFEALLRWNHPTRGAVSPADFIPIAEECGLIESIGEWVLRTACTDAAAWPPFVRVAVNVSPIQFANPGLPALVLNALATSGISADRLELEITEGVFLDESPASAKMFKSLKAIGVRLALDDFGTGYSSLGYLKSAPFDKIKIDQSFVRGAAIPGNRNAAIIRAIVSMADSLYMETTAEGVEHEDEIELIRQLGCSHIQGYIYGRPARADDVLHMLTEGGGMAVASGYKVSRSDRNTMLRTARLEVGRVQGEILIRNLSSTGALIDGIDFGRRTEGVSMLIELVEGQMFPATLKWAKDGKAGIEFVQTFNMERLNPGRSQGKARISAA